MKEEIRIIPWTNGHYGVRSSGNVYSYYDLRGKKRSTPIKRKLKPNNSGYLRFGFNINGKRRRFFVHRLVAELFVPNPDNLPQVNHKNEDKLDNRAENLEWCTHEYNQNYGSHNERVSRSNSKTIVQLSDNGNIINTFIGIDKAAMFFNLTRSIVAKMLNNRRRNTLNLHYEESLNKSVKVPLKKSHRSSVEKF